MLRAYNEIEVDPSWNKDLPLEYFINRISGKIIKYFYDNYHRKNNSN